MTQCRILSVDHSNCPVPSMCTADPAGVMIGHDVTVKQCPEPGFDGTDLCLKHLRRMEMIQRASRNERIPKQD